VNRAPLVSILERLLIRPIAAAALLTLVIAAPVAAQTASPDILGTWQARADAEVRQVIIRADSSASYGDETVRWRVRGETIMIALGGEWVCYKIRVKGTSMILSEGDLTKPITLKRIGPPKARPDSVAVPPDPETGCT